MLITLIPQHIWCLYCLGQLGFRTELSFLFQTHFLSSIFFSFIKPQHMTALESSGKTTLNLRSQNYVKLDGKYIHFTFYYHQKRGAATWIYGVYSNVCKCRLNYGCPWKYHLQLIFPLSSVIYSMLFYAGCMRSFSFAPGATGLRASKCWKWRRNSTTHNYETNTHTHTHTQTGLRRTSLLHVLFHSLEPLCCLGGI